MIPRKGSPELEKPRGNGDTLRNLVIKSIMFKNLGMTRHAKIIPWLCKHKEKYVKFIYSSNQRINVYTCRYIMKTPTVNSLT